MDGWMGNSSSVHVQLLFSLSPIFKLFYFILLLLFYVTLEMSRFRIN